MVPYSKRAWRPADGYTNPRKNPVGTTNFSRIGKTESQDNPESRKQFYANFDWADLTLNPTKILQCEELLVDFHDIFERHRFNIGINDDF